MTSKKQHSKLIAKAQKRQSWLLFAVIVVAVVVDFVFFESNLTVAKSVSLGGFLAYAMQLVFTFISYRRDAVLVGKYRYNALMMDMYLAVVAKWLFAIVCFGFIFLFIKSINFLAFFVGLITMQLFIMVALLATNSP